MPTWGGGGRGGGYFSKNNISVHYVRLEVTLNLCFKETIIIYTAVNCFAVIYNNL